MIMMKYWSYFYHNFNRSRTQPLHVYKFEMETITNLFVRQQPLENFSHCHNFPSYLLVYILTQCELDKMFEFGWKNMLILVTVHAPEGPVNMELFSIV